MFIIHSGQSPAIWANISTKKSILSACAVFQCTNYFTAMKWVHKLKLWWGAKTVLTFSHVIYVHKVYQEFSSSSSCHLAEEVEFSLQLAISLFCLMLMKRSTIDFGIYDFSKVFVILYLIQQNATLMWYQSCNRYVLEDLTVSAHHWVTAWTSWYQQLFYWN